MHDFVNNMHKIVVVANGDNDLLWLMVYFGLFPVGVLDIGIAFGRLDRRDQKADFNTIMQGILGNVRLFYKRYNYESE